MEKTKGMPPMDIRQLEAYVYTVKYRSFSLAAQKLYLSQPTVSAHTAAQAHDENTFGDTGRPNAV